MSGKIDPVRLREMIRAGESTRTIARTFDVRGVSVIRACHAASLPLPGTRRAKAQPVVPEPQTEPHHSPRKGALIATGGRYAALALWAQAWDVSMAQARIEWSRLGLPLDMGAGR